MYSDNSRSRGWFPGNELLKYAIFIQQVYVCIYMIRIWIKVSFEVGYSRTGVQPEILTQHGSVVKINYTEQIKSILCHKGLQILQSFRDVSAYFGKQI